MLVRTMWVFTKMVTYYGFSTKKAFYWHMVLPSTPLKSFSVQSICTHVVPPQAYYNRVLVHEVHYYDVASIQLWDSNWIWPFFLPTQWQREKAVWLWETISFKCHNLTDNFHYCFSFVCGRRENGTFCFHSLEHIFILKNGNSIFCSIVPGIILYAFL